MHSTFKAKIPVDEGEVEVFEVDLNAKHLEKRKTASEKRADLTICHLRTGQVFTAELRHAMSRPLSDMPDVGAHYDIRSVGSGLQLGIPVSLKEALELIARCSRDVEATRREEHRFLLEDCEPVGASEEDGGEK